MSSQRPLYINLVQTFLMDWFADMKDGAMRPGIRDLGERYAGVDQMREHPANRLEWQVDHEDADGSACHRRQSHRDALADKFESSKRINSILETNGNFESRNSC